jgi:hypothetical protein
MAMISQKNVVVMFPGNMQRLLAHNGKNVKIKFAGFVKSPDAALRCILRHCGVRRVRLMTQDLHALPADLFTKPSIMANFKIFLWVG